MFLLNLLLKVEEAQSGRTQLGLLDGKYAGLPDEIISLI